jgi:DNA-binding NarL/FixJ family response regulator
MLKLGFKAHIFIGVVNLICKNESKAEIMQIALIGVKPVISNVITGSLKQLQDSELSIYTMEQVEDDWAFITHYDVAVINLNASHIPIKTLLKTIREVSNSTKIIGVHSYSNKKLIDQLFDSGLDAYIELNQVNAQLPDTIKRLSKHSID